MKFLDEIGLAYFWEKIKASFVKTKGASEIEMDDDNEGLRVNNVSSSSTTLVPSGFISYNINSDEQSEMVAKLQFGDLILKKIHIINGTSSQILIADGSIKTINAANGICGLDANGRIPLAQLGNLDTSLFKLVTSLPSSGESNKIYIVKDGSDANDVYQEYYYTNGAWEKIGTHAVKVDLTPYAKKSEAINNLKVETQPTGVNSKRQYIGIYNADNKDNLASEISILEATTNMSGFMSYSDKKKLDGIEYGANDYSLPLAANGTRGGIQVGYAANGRNYPVQLSGEKAYVNVPWTDTNTTYDLSPYAKTADVNKALAKKVDVVSGKGLSTEDFTAALKTKLNGIATGATADSAITTAEIDALFA